MMLPNMANAVMAWMIPMTGVCIESYQDENFETRERERKMDFRGVRAPLKAQQLEKKPEGQRAWRWEVLHATTEFNVRPNDVVILNCNRYRVDAKFDYAEYGYYEYHLVQDFKP